MTSKIATDSIVPAPANKSSAVGISIGEQGRMATSLEQLIQFTGGWGFR